ncbi:23S rRNA (uracil1939-C5)-methyltransferase [Lachnospiraceae bacterium C7]|nr:23S rRNA (uracil1939-C5)-methyltransferase [Lachnospiraceae bacterium C7]
MEACKYKKKCGGCDYQGLTYEEQLEKKQRHVNRLLKKYGKVQRIVGMKDPYHYRHKVNAAFTYTRAGKILAGTYKEGTHDVVDIPECQIENLECKKVINTIKKLIKSFKIKTYDEDTGYGLLRHVMVRKSYYNDEIMVVLVLSSPILPSKNNFVKALRKEVPQISTVVINVNDKNTSMVLGERNITIYGKGFIEDKLCGLTFRISPSSFYQVNPEQTEKIYYKAMEYAKVSSKKTVIDAYCGTGTIGLVASKNAKEVIGVELNKDAVKDAIINAKKNNMRNIKFYNEDATEYMLKASSKKQKTDVIIMDPPRSGSTEEFMAAAVKMSPNRISYVSCNPETLARDLEYFTKNGYEVKEITPYDQFPFTKHIECVCCLRKVD